MQNKMKKILCSLGIILLIIFNVRAEDEQGIKVDVLAKTTSSWDGNMLPNYPLENPEITILKFTIFPGTQLPLHYHPVINAGVLISGELTVITEDNEILYLKAGETIVEVVDKWHYGKNEGDLPAEIIVFYAGTPEIPITIKKED